MTKAFARLRRDCRAATAIEYGLIAALIVVAVIVGVGGLGGRTGGMWGNVSTAVINAG